LIKVIITDHCLAACPFFLFNLQVGQTNIQRREEKQATREARFAIAPFLQAEEDLRYVAARRNGNIPKSVYKTPGLWFPPSK
jgi:hypothetical protein